MKKMLRVVAYVLALNFLVASGGTAYLWRSGHLDRTRIAGIKGILFPPAPPAALASLADASANAGSTTQPSLQMDALIKKAAGLSAEQQVEFLQRSFDARMAQLDLLQRQLADQQRLVDFGRQTLATDRAALEAQKKRLADAQQQAAAQAGDQGFQDSLQVYLAMPAASVKAIFMNLPQDVVERYLEAMPPRTAGKIIKEFKTPDETGRIQKVLELMRKGTAPDSEPTAAATPAAP